MMTYMVPHMTLCTSYGCALRVCMFLVRRDIHTFVLHIVYMPSTHTRHTHSKCICPYSVHRGHLRKIYHPTPMHQYGPKSAYAPPPKVVVSETYTLKVHMPPRAPVLGGIHTQSAYAPRAHVLGDIRTQSAYAPQSPFSARCAMEW